MDTLPQSKVCSKCSTRKDSSAFHPCKQNPDGLFSYCRDCRKEYDLQRRAMKGAELNAKAREWKEANTERIQATGLAYRQQRRAEISAQARERYRLDPDKVKAEQRAWKRRNPEWNRAKSKQWAEQNPEKWKRIIQDWKDANPERNRSNHRNYRARRRMAEGSHTQRIPLGVVAQQL